MLAGADVARVVLGINPDISCQRLCLARKYSLSGLKPVAFEFFLILVIGENVIPRNGLDRLSTAVFKRCPGRVLENVDGLAGNPVKGRRVRALDGFVLLDGLRTLVSRILPVKTENGDIGSSRVIVIRQRRGNWSQPR